MAFGQMSNLRKKRQRNRDPHRGSPSQIVPYQPGESTKRRHARRYFKNLENWTALQDWAFERGFSFQMKNRGEHWILKGAGIICEWWPSTAKLVLNYEYRDGRHTHDWLQLCAILDKI